MRLKSFRVRNFRSIDDSGDIPVDAVTAMVGRNESGKTTLLKALHKFNPAGDEPINPQRDFPRDRYTRDFKNPEDWPFCSATFELTPSQRAHLHGLLGGEKPPTSVTCTRYYDADYLVEFEPEPTAGVVDPHPAIEALKQMAGKVRRFRKPADESEHAAFDEAKSQLIGAADKWSSELGGFADLRSEAGAEKLESLRREMNGISSPYTADVIEELLEVVEPTLEAAKIEPPIDQAEAYIIEQMPVFIYFENYGILDSAIYLPHFLRDEKAAPSPRTRTIHAMFQHVNLSAEEIAGLGREEADKLRHAGQAVTETAIQSDMKRLEERAIKLNSASLDITQRFGDWWSQRRHNIRYHADGDYFRIWVSDDRRPGVEIELEERSKGFQWFFSFYLVFLVESEEGHKDAILLLDEPGLHLHPTAQQELLTFFDDLATKNQLVYTTHSPFLIDANHLERVRPVVEDESGHSRISVGDWPPDRETIFPLQAAAGYAMVRGLFQNRDNLLVEGMVDYYLLSMFDQQCRAVGRQALPTEVYVVPVGGTKNMGGVASLFLGQNVRPLVLLDGDQAGQVRRDALLRDLYAGQASFVLMLSDVLGGDAETEDLVGPELFCSALNEATELGLELVADDHEAGSTPKIIEAAAARQGVTLPDGWKPRAALQVVRNWSANADYLPSEALDRAELVFAEIARRFG